LGILKLRYLHKFFFSELHLFSEIIPSVAFRHRQTLSYITQGIYMSGKILVPDTRRSRIQLRQKHEWAKKQEDPLALFVPAHRLTSEDSVMEQY
jgi:hypothetical protein